MPELRKDPISGRWVIVATERAMRPTDFKSDPQPIKGGYCPFCEGNEDKTPQRSWHTEKEEHNPIQKDGG